MLVVCLVLVAVTGLSFVGLGALNGYLLLLMWPIPFLLAAGYYGVALSSLVGFFIFKSQTRKIIAACVFVFWLISFFVQLIL